MASLNKVMLIGNLTRDPELRYIPSGSAVASFTLAMNRVYKLQTGEKKEEVSFVKVIVWGRMAEVCGEYITKGSPVFVEGRLQSRSWDGPDGQKRSVLEVIAVNIQFLRGQQSPSKDRELPIEAVQSSSKEDIPEIQLEEFHEGGKSAEDTPF